jgi:purine-cytosine permease-like protein
MPGLFSWPAGTGDTIVGLLAPVVGIAYARSSRNAAGLVRAWNWFGIVDLIVAVTTGLLTSPSPLRLFALGAPNELVSAFPLAMVPVFLVPLWVLLHLASLKKLQQTETGRQLSHPLLASERS